MIASSTNGRMKLQVSIGRFVQSIAVVRTLESYPDRLATCWCSMFGIGDIGMPGRVPAGARWSFSPLYF